VLLKHANKVLEKNFLAKEYSIGFDEFEGLMGSHIKSSTTGITERKKILEESMKSILETSFGFGMDNEIKRSVFIQFFEITDNKIIYIFSNYVQEFLNPINQALIINNFPLLMSFRSEYARHLYKHILSWIKMKNELTIKLIDLKEFLGVPSTQSYNRTDNLETKVIKVAIEEINSKTDWNVIYKKNKVGKQIVSITFFWDSQKKLAISK
jgi:plasmid replication initiation protein